MLSDEQIAKIKGLAFTAGVAGREPIFHVRVSALEPFESRPMVDGPGYTIKIRVDTNETFGQEKPLAWMEFVMGGKAIEMQDDLPTRIRDILVDRFETDLVNEFETGLRCRCLANPDAATHPDSEADD